ncbi:MAG: hypothetical protein DRP29_09275 [Thermodesulfobacteriota bacterium]|nr:MAG: hypothetical protein DRP29_09275 [Thermodesulfobacteriota bacterium]
MEWRDKVDPQVKPFLDALVKEVLMHKEAYSSAENPGGAQIWVALGVLAKQVNDLNARIAVLERAVKEASKNPATKDTETGKKKKENEEDPAKLLSKVLKRI